MGNRFIFQHDNAPPHVARKTKERLVEEGVMVVSWPPYSPDLNPVENLWAIISSNVYRETACFENEDLVWKSVKRVSEAISNDTCSKLVKGLPDRVEAIARNNRGYLK